MVTVVQAVQCNVQVGVQQPRELRHPAAAMSGAIVGTAIIHTVAALPARVTTAGTLSNHKQPTPCLIGFCAAGVAAIRDSMTAQLHIQRTGPGALCSTLACPSFCLLGSAHCDSCALSTPSNTPLSCRTVSCAPQEDCRPAGGWQAPHCSHPGGRRGGGCCPGGGV
jgi:hypothetical protein